MEARIVRIEQCPQGAVGIFYFSGLGFTCWVLQPDEADPDKFHIPAGRYTARRVGGESWRRWPNTFEIVRPGADGVDGHTALLFHAGNIEQHTDGCTLMGARAGKLTGQRAVLNSGETFRQFLKFTKNTKQFDLEIADFYWNVKNRNKKKEETRQ